MTAPVHAQLSAQSDDCAIAPDGKALAFIATDENGIVDFNSGISQVNHRTPFEDRWGGWYVTGTHGKQTHRGNLIGKAAFERQANESNFASRRISNRSISA